MEPEFMKPEFLEIDCREMEPPEPMLVILQSLEGLKPGMGLKVLHRMEPFPLYPKLTERGFAHRVEGEQPNLVIWITKEN